MATILDVVNECLGTLGESPLNSLLEPHEFRGTAQRELAAAFRTKSRWLKDGGERKFGTVSTRRW